ncbi:MAG: hypothetical protein EBU26_15695 [Verrucomicrobia bacterium]|nr:hypothetical protein [Verrucomicrobiota bacterium]
MAKERDRASSNSVRSRLQQRLAEANNFQKALITSLLAWVALGVWSYLIVVPILSVVAFLWLGGTGWLIWRIWRKPAG